MNKRIKKKIAKRKEKEWFPDSNYYGITSIETIEKLRKRKWSEMALERVCRWELVRL